MSGRDRSYTDLMRELWGSPSQMSGRKTYAEVAKKLGVDEETVRNRLKRLKDSGFLLGWRLVPNPLVLGMKSAVLLLEFEDPESKEEAIPKLERADGVVVIASIYGRSLMITLYDEENDRFSKKLAEMGVRGKVLQVPGFGLPRSAFRMSATDWQIAGAMVRDAEKDPAEIAAEVGVSPRTVKRRFDGMLKASAVFVMPVTDQRNASGISYQLVVESEDGRAAEVGRLIASKIEDLIFRASDSKGGMIFGFFGSNVAEGNEILKWVKQQQGVRSAKMNIVDRVVYVFGWLEKEFERRVAASDTAAAHSTQH